MANNEVKCGIIYDKNVIQVGSDRCSIINGLMVDDRNSFIINYSIKSIIVPKRFGNLF